MSRTPDPQDVGPDPCCTCRLVETCRRAWPPIACSDFAAWCERGGEIDEHPDRPRVPTAAIAKRLGL